MKKKILLIHSGGTIGMTRDSRSDARNNLINAVELAAATKLMFLLGQYDQPALIRNNFQKSLAGEMTILP